MQDRFLMILKLFSAIAIIVLVLLGAAYVMNVLPEEAMKKTVGKAMILIGIFAGGSLALTFVLSGKKDGEDPSADN